MFPIQKYEWKRSKYLSENDFCKLMSNWKMQETFLLVTGD